MGTSLERVSANLTLQLLQIEEFLENHGTLMDQQAYKLLTSEVILAFNVKGSPMYLHLSANDILTVLNDHAQSLRKELSSRPAVAKSKS